MDGNLSSYLLANFSEEFCSSSRTLHSVPEVICRKSCMLSSRESSEVGGHSNKYEKLPLSSRASQACPVSPLRGVSRTNYTEDVPFSIQVPDEKRVGAARKLVLSEEILPRLVTQSKEETAEVSREGTAFDKKPVDFSPRNASSDEQVLDRFPTESFSGGMGLSFSYLGVEIPKDLQTDFSSQLKPGPDIHSLTDDNASVAGMNLMYQELETGQKNSSYSANLKKQCISPLVSGNSDVNLLLSTRKMQSFAGKVSSSQTHGPAKTSKSDSCERKDQSGSDNEVKFQNRCDDERLLDSPSKSNNLAVSCEPRPTCEEVSFSSGLHDCDVEVRRGREGVLENGRHGNGDQTIQDEYDAISSEELLGEKSPYNSVGEGLEETSSLKTIDNLSNTVAQSSKNKTSVSEVQFSPQNVCCLKLGHEIDMSETGLEDDRCRGAEPFSDVPRTEFESNEVVKRGQSAPKKEAQLCLSPAEFGDGRKHDLPIFLNRNFSLAQPENIRILAKDEKNKCAQTEGRDAQQTIVNENEELCKDIPAESKELHQGSMQAECDEFHTNMRNEKAVQGSPRAHDEHRDFEDDPYPSIVSSDSGVFAPICGSDKDDIFPHRFSVEVSSFSECEEFESLQSELLSSLTEGNDVFAFSFNSPLSGKVFRDDMEAPQGHEIRSPFCTNNSMDEECIGVSCQDGDHPKNFNESFDTSFTEKILNKISSLQSPVKVTDRNATGELFNKENRSVKCSESDYSIDMTHQRARDDSLGPFSKPASASCSGLCDIGQKEQEGSHGRRNEDCAQLDIVTPSKNHFSTHECPLLTDTEKLTKSLGLSSSLVSNATLAKQNARPFVDGKICVGTRSELDALAGCANLSEDLKDAIWKAMKKEEEIRERQARGVADDKSDEELEEGSAIGHKSEANFKNVVNSKTVHGKIRRDRSQSDFRCGKNDKIDGDPNTENVNDKNPINYPHALNMFHSDEKTNEVMLRSGRAQQISSQRRSISENGLHNQRKNSLFALRQQLNFRKKNSVGSMTDSSSLLSDYLRIQLRISSLLSEVKTMSKEAQNSRNEFSSLQTRTNNICEERDDLLKLRDSILTV